MNKSDVIKYSLSLANTFEDRPFPDNYSSVIMKHTDNKKWFALIMEVKGEVYLNIKTDSEYFEIETKTIINVWYKKQIISVYTNYVDLQRRLNIILEKQN